MRKFAQGGPTRMLGTADLSLLEAVFEPLPDCPFFVKDRERRYVAANRAMARLCGVARPRQLYGLRAADIFPAALAERYEMFDAEVLTNGAVIANRLELTRDAEGGDAWLLFSRTAIHNDAGDVVGLVATSQRLDPGSAAHKRYVRLATVAKRIREELDQPLRVAQLAAEASISLSQLNRDFARLFGVTPSTFLHRCRIEMAQQLLTEPSSLAHVAVACGYADQSAFTRRFRAEIGVPPGKWRAQARVGSPRPLAMPTDET